MTRPESYSNMAGSELSINSLVAPNDYPSGSLYPTLTPTMSKKTFTMMPKIMGTLTRSTNPPGSASSKLSVRNMKKNHSYMGSQTSLASGSNFSRKSGGGFNDSDYFNGHDPTFLQRASLYIFGDRSQMKNVRLESHPKAEFIPIDFPEPRKIRASFKKLMRACVPSAASSQPDQSFLKMVEGSEWFT